MAGFGNVSLEISVGLLFFPLLPVDVERMLDVATALLQSKLKYTRFDLLAV